MTSQEFKRAFFSQTGHVDVYVVIRSTALNENNMVLNLATKPY